MMRFPRFAPAAAAALLAAAACSPAGSDGAGGDSTGAAPQPGARAGATAPPGCPSGNAGLTLPAGFCATVFADSLGTARHLTVAPNGDVYLNTWTRRGGRRTGTPPAGGPLVALRDTNRDGRADLIARFGATPAEGDVGGPGIALHAGALYADAGPRIVRYALPAGELVPTAAAETVVDGFPSTGSHPHHNFVIDPAGSLYANMGSASNSCQREDRTLESPGRTPCTELETRAGIWRFDAARTGQRFSPQARYATGIRNAVGLAVDPSTRALFATQHGRDQLAENWPALYQPAQGQELPAEQLMRVEQGADFGWPVCYYDPAQRKLVLAPEYGGDGGRAVGECASKRAPAATFPAHWAPNDLLFYSGAHFPARYRNGAFIAFHGSWNRAPGPQGGYVVAFVPRSADGGFGAAETFADGFAGAVKQPDRAVHRPTGLAQGPDGALYISDDKQGRVWRVTYRGE